jgi:parallel beta-helix repeat protein
MNKKILIAGLLVSVILLVPINSAYNNIGIKIQNNPVIKSNRGVTLYVGGNGSGNYSKIQDAIDNASYGDTVFVYDDRSPYYEHIRIEGKIKNLIGEDKNTTVIDGGGTDYVAIIVSMYEGVFSGFTIKNGDYGVLFYTLQKSYVENNIFTDNNRIAVGLESSYRNIISNNTIENNAGGIRINDCNNNTISYNRIENNSDNDSTFYDALSLSDSSDNIISNNFISNNEGTGISSTSNQFTCSKNTVIQNTIVNNFYGGICLSHYSYDFLILNNIISNNSHYGIYLWENNNVIIENNIISDNNGAGIYIWADVYNLNISKNILTRNNDSGIVIWYSSHITVFENSIFDNLYGIILWGVNSLNIRKNIIQGSFEGIYFFVSDNNILFSNHFQENTFGINITSSKNNKITNNNFLKNNRNAIFFDGRNKWKGNFWDRTRLLPKPIWGRISIGKNCLIPWFQLDWHPALEPYDI